MSSNVWFFDPRVPVAFWVKVACVLPSPQSTSTAHGESAPGSENEPRENEAPFPSFELWSEGPVTVGATFEMFALKVPDPEPPSLSVTFTVTV